MNNMLSLKSVLMLQMQQMVQHGTIHQLCLVVEQGLILMLMRFYNITLLMWLLISREALALFLLLNKDIPESIGSTCQFLVYGQLIQAPWINSLNLSCKAWVLTHILEDLLFVHFQWHLQSSMSIQWPFGRLGLSFQMSIMLISQDNYLFL